MQSKMPRFRNGLIKISQVLGLVLWRGHMGNAAAFAELRDLSPEFSAAN